jgi:hypothetical protein
VNEGRRAYDLLRGYVNREWDRLQGLDPAQRELEEALDPTYKSQVPHERENVSEYEPVFVGDEKDQARRVLGVGVNDDFNTIRQAFEKLNRRSTPSNFPEGSIEAVHAAEIQKRVNWAYAVLSQDIDETEKRFRSLEID